jgi:predicted RNA-binding Zn-ribbon protein involved in translation (DUF1610 family)
MHPQLSGGLMDFPVLLSWDSNSISFSCPHCKEVLVVVQAARTTLQLELKKEHRTKLATHFNSSCRMKDKQSQSTPPGFVPYKDGERFGFECSGCGKKVMRRISQLNPPRFCMVFDEESQVEMYMHLAICPAAIKARASSGTVLPFQIIPYY